MQTLYGNQSNNFQQGCQKKLYKFFSFPDIERESFSFLTKTNAVGLSKLLSTCSQEQFERNNFFKKCLEFLLFFSDMSNKSLAFCQISFNWIVKKVFHEPKGTSWRKKFSKKIENIWVFNFFSDFDQKKMSAFRQAFFDRVEETAFYVSIDIFWGELFEKKLFSVIFGQRSIFFRCKTQYSTIPQERSNQVFFGINVYFLPFRFLNEKFWYSVKRFATGLSKLNPSCPQESLEEKYFFLKKL